LAPRKVKEFSTAATDGFDEGYPQIQPSQLKRLLRRSRLSQIIDLRVRKGKVSRKDAKSAKNNKSAPRTAHDIIRCFSFFALLASWRELSFLYANINNADSVKGGNRHGTIVAGICAFLRNLRIAAPMPGIVKKGGMSLDISEILWRHSRDTD